MFDYRPARAERVSPWMFRCFYGSLRRVRSAGNLVVIQVVGVNVRCNWRRICDEKILNCYVIEIDIIKYGPHESEFIIDSNWSN